MSLPKSADQCPAVYMKVRCRLAPEHVGYHRYWTEHGSVGWVDLAARFKGDKG